MAASDESGGIFALLTRLFDFVLEPGCVKTGCEHAHSGGSHILLSFLWVMWLTDGVGTCSLFFRFVDAFCPECCSTVCCHSDTQELSDHRELADGGSTERGFLRDLLEMMNDSDHSTCTNKTCYLYFRGEYTCLCLLDTNQPCTYLLQQHISLHLPFFHFNVCNILALPSYLPSLSFWLLPPSCCLMSMLNVALIIAVCVLTKSFIFNYLLYS